MEKYFLVAAIDFGTTYSGYAFGMVRDLEEDPMKIHANQAWVSGQQSLLSLKTPTCLLLDNNKKFKSFGYEAENQYSNITMDEETEDYYYFYRFKMNLHESEESLENLKIKDASGKKLPAMTVFSLSIKALKDHLLDLLDTRGTTLKADEVLWVLTVPAIWSDSAKMFMRKAAKKAGIKDNCLKLALEPEAASIHCQHIHVDRTKGQRGFGVSAVGTRYMVIDLGGGTADITCHEKLDDDFLKELYKASGGACGGTAMDAKVLGVIREIVGESVFNEFRRVHVEGYMDLLREIEVFKRNIKPESDGKINMTIPYVSLQELCSIKLNKSFKELLAVSSVSNDISLTGNKLRFSADFAKQLFTSITDQIVEYIRLILMQPEVQNINRFLLVGGFSESPMVQHAIKANFPDKRLIIPQEAGLAVLKGAVLFGHRPKTIKSRVIKYSYGVKTTPVFDPMVHDPKRRCIIDGVDRCQNVFSCFMKSGTAVEVEHEIEKKYQTNEVFQQTVPLELFFSIKEDPKYIDEPCVQKLWKMDINIPHPCENPRKVKVLYIFGDTELRVTAVEMDTGTPCEATIGGIC
ncbi:heat shock 70 kDa protein 12B-like [Saccostrea echinata]|uniref:heat shock 70 kDa protein 12B-like n=1 Tax=Saccostrea echinata TaxID=191078 RepID=UPI002A7F47F2|nr:heat shock 70 kDa protein 12B-like [Saccostrea echinata]